MTYRKALSAVALLGVLGTIGSFVLQYMFGMNPCPLCILQRVAIIATGLAALLALLLPTAKKGGRLLAALWVSLPAAWGLGVAVYQLWLQSLPLSDRPSCGAPWTFRLRDWPLFDWWEPVVRGFGDCGVSDAVLGISLPVWSVLMFGAVLLWLWVMWFKLREK